MMKANAKLVARDGELVHEFVMPPFQLLPEACTWGLRIFLLAKPFEQTPSTEMIYHEACAWSVDASIALWEVHDAAKTH